MSLRARLLLCVVLLVAAGLAVADTVTYDALQGFLLKRVDQQLLDARPAVLRGLGRPPGPVPGPGAPRLQLPPGTYGALVTGGGSVLAQTSFRYTTQQASLPHLPRNFAALVDSAQTSQEPVEVNVSGDYRLLVQALPSGDALVVGVPLVDLHDTLRRLLGLEVAVSALVVIGTVAAGFVLVGVGLRPLRRIGATAGAIAGGDLGRRVSPATPRTEIGQLGLALNAMLAQIEEAFDQRRASEERLRRFVADASHELRTPLTAVRGYAEMFDRGASERPADLATLMRRIQAESGRMAVLVEDLLALARLDEHRPLRHGSVDLSAVLADAALDVRVLDPSRRVTVASPGRVSVAGEEARLRQAVGNLVRNAVVHTPAGSPLELELHMQGGTAELRVIDHGAGVPPELVAKVFERFFRADPARSRDRGGSGLGLAIVAAVAGAHGGSVRLVDTPGGGATFVLRLPGGVPRPAAPLAPAAPAIASQRQQQHPGEGGPGAGQLAPGEPFVQGGGGEHRGGDRVERAEHPGHRQ